MAAGQQFKDMNELRDFLIIYLKKQLTSYLPDNNCINNQDIKKTIINAFDRTIYCFSKIKIKYYCNERNEPNFNYLHSDQYATFLYFVSNEAFRCSNQILHEKTSYLNKILHGIDLYGHIIMPDIFLLVHPIGTVIGRASFNNYTIIYQGVTIGGKHQNDIINYPSFNKKTAFFSNCSVIGDVHCGENTVFASNSSIINGHYNDNSLIAGNYPNVSIKKYETNIFSNFFSI